MIEPRIDRLPVSSDPAQLIQAATMHVGEIKDLKDPEGRGRVKVEVRGLLDQGGGYKNWTNWCEVSALPIGSKHGNGDVGMWWAPVPGQTALVYFLGGDYFVLPFFMSGPVWNAKKKEKKQDMIPAEAKILSDKDPRQGTRIRLLKSESGATLAFDDNGKTEATWLLDWTGAGLAMVSPGKKEDEEEKPKQESKWRKGEVRGTNNVFNSTSKKPSEIVEGKVGILAMEDLLGSGIYFWAEEDKGKVCILAAKEKDDASKGCSIVMDVENSCIILTAGETQLVLDDKKGHIEVTRQLIQEQPKREIKEFFAAFWDRLGSYFDRFKKYEPPKPEKSQTSTKVTYA
jgi:hypothetical protein